jgi:hypothetical protein
VQEEREVRMRIDMHFHVAGKGTDIDDVENSVYFFRMITIFFLHESCTLWWRRT